MSIFDQTVEAMPEAAHRLGYFAQGPRLPEPAAQAAEAQGTAWRTRPATAEEAAPAGSDSGAGEAPAGSEGEAVPAEVQEAAPEPAAARGPDGEDDEPEWDSEDSSRYQDQHAGDAAHEPEHTAEADASVLAEHPLKGAQ
jgi:hypothetical protein